MTNDGQMDVQAAVEQLQDKLFCDYFCDEDDVAIDAVLAALVQAQQENKRLKDEAAHLWMRQCRGAVAGQRERDVQLCKDRAERWRQEHLKGYDSLALAAECDNCALAIKRGSGDES